MTQDWFDRRAFLKGGAAGGAAAVAAVLPQAKDHAGVTRHMQQAFRQ